MEKQVQFAVYQIKEQESCIYRNTGGEVCDTKFKLRFNKQIFKDDNLVEILIEIDLVDKTSDNRFVHIVVSNVYKIENLSQFESENVFILPNQLLEVLISLSISHSRAIMAKNTSGTAYANYFLPIINPSEIVNQIEN